jgi:Cu2+-exporting ATPase
MGQALEAIVSCEETTCRHCGLLSQGPYCCYGCELAAGIAAEAAHNQSRTKALLTLSLLLSMSVMMLSLFLYAEDVYGADGDPAMAKLRGLWRLASAILATPVIALLGVPLFVHALRAGRITMELLVATGALAAYGLSLLGVWRGSGVYFDSATSALVLTTLGRYLEASARAKASGLLGPSLASASTTVLAASDDDGDLRPLAPQELRAGMRLQIPVDGILPVDARLLAPVDVNLGVLTGESLPKTLAAGAEVPAGAVPVSGPLDAVAAAAVRDSTLERLAELARGLHARRSRLQRAADLFAQALTPLVLLVATLAFAWWTRHASVERAVVVSLAVVLAACPCTFGIATPLALWLTLRRALGEGVLLRNAQTLEALAQVRTVAFDKTGTLTAGTLRLGAIETQQDPAEMLALAAALEDGSRHPIARALASPKKAALSERRFEPGGVIGRDRRGRLLLLGSPAFLTAHGVSCQETVRVLLAIEGKVVARFALDEEVRPEAEAAVAALRSDGLGVSLLTGDSAARARPVALALGVELAADLSATDKAARLGPRTAMVGDGLNDAPALASVPSFAMEGGSSLARGMAGATLLRADLRLVPWTLRLARRAMRLSRRNLALSVAYNLAFLGLALSGTLRPVWAGLSMLGSSLLMLASTIGLASAPGVE